MHRRLIVALGVSVVLSGPLGGLLLAGGRLVGMSRGYLGVHYPGDVLAGWLLALAGYIAAGMLPFACCWLLPQ